jgi:hypothetical protein
VGVWGDDRDHCVGCQVGLGQDEPCPIPACPCYGLTGFAAIIAAERADPRAKSVARRVAAGTAGPGDLLGAGDDPSWQAWTAARALAVRYEAGPEEKRASGMDGKVALEYLKRMDDLGLGGVRQYERVTEFRPEIS